MVSVMTSPGFTTRQVQVMEVDSTKAIAYCQVVGSEQNKMKLTYLPLTVHQQPRRGDTWLIEKQQQGNWIFKGLIRGGDTLVAPDTVMGYGSPQTVKTADHIGQTYIDLDQTGGAVRWRAVNTSPSYWTPVEGDTGWHNITGHAGTGYPNPVLSVRRINSMVTMSLGVTSTTASASASFTIPPGLFPMSPNSSQVLNFTVPGKSSGTGTFTIDPTKQQATMQCGAADTYQVNATWQTDNSWPPLS